MSYFTFESIGVAARINCSCCGMGMDCHKRKPRTGVCGHTICDQCYIAKYIGQDWTVPPSPGEFYRCCAPLCDERGFKIGHPASSSVMAALSLLERLKWEVNRHLIKIHDQYKAFDVMGLQHQFEKTKKKLEETNKELKDTKTELFCAQQENELLQGDFMRVNRDLEDTKKEMLGKLEETKKQLSDSQIGKELAEDALVGVKTYMKGVRERLADIPTGKIPERSGLSPPGTLSQEMEQLEERMETQKKREYNTDTDSSIGSLEGPVTKKVKAGSKKPRKVSMEGVKKNNQISTVESNEEEDITSFPYTALSDHGLTNQSTQENEF